MSRLLLLAGLALLVGAWPASDAAAQVERRTDAPLIHTWDEPVKTGSARAESRHVDIVFDYARGAALERTYDASGALLSEREIAPPTPSDEEVAEAIAIIEADAELAPLIEASGAAVEGGFLYLPEDFVGVEGTVDFKKPLKACERGARCLQFDLVGPDRETSVRFVVVDLATRRVVEHDLFPHLD